MERAGRIMTGLKGTASCVPSEIVARKAWAAAVGKRIGAHAKAVALDRSTLIVDVDDAIWQRSLYTLRPQILRKLHGFLGPSIVTSLDFRIAIPRRPPERVETHAREKAPLFDEADAIHDPFLRRLYIGSRKKASA